MTRAAARAGTVEDTTRPGGGRTDGKDHPWPPRT